MPKLTKAEKKARKLEKAAEKLRLAEEAKLQQKKDQIKREVAMQELSLSQMDRSWRHFMIQLKLPFFRNEVKAIWSIFDRVMDKKEALLNQLRHQMREADHQQRLSLAAFSDSVDLQLQRLYTVLEDMDKAFKQDSKVLRKRGEDERLSVEAMKDRAEWSMAVLRWAMAQGNKDAVDHFQGESVVKYFEKDLMYNNDREDLENTLERRFTLISDLYKELLKDYFAKTADNRKKLEKLRPKDTMMLNIIIKQERRTGENFLTLKRLRQVVESYEDGTVMAGVRENYKRNRDAYLAAKNKMDADLKLDVTQFTDLVEINNETIDWLKGVTRKSEQILTAARLCRKLQTDHEIAGKLKDNEPLLMYSEATESPRMNKTLESYDELKPFWALVAEADISRKSLQDERNKLTRENERLRQYFKEWMEEHKYGTDSYKPPSQNFGTLSVVEAAHEFTKIGYQIE